MNEIIYLTLFPTEQKGDGSCARLRCQREKDVTDHFQQEEGKIHSHIKMLPSAKGSAKEVSHAFHVSTNCVNASPVKMVTGTRADN